MPSLPTLPATTIRALRLVAADMRRVFGDRFVALVASGPTSSVAFAASITAGDLDALGPLAESWRRAGLDIPLMLSPDEFARSLDAFPVEYQAILDRHLVIDGHPPFTGVVVDANALRRACEVQAKSHLIHLRQGWIEAAGHDHELAMLIVRSATPLRALLTNVATLEQTAPEDVAERAGMPRSLVTAILALETAPDGARQLVPRLAEYVEATERLWSFVDGWRQR